MKYLRDTAYRKGLTEWAENEMMKVVVYGWNRPGERSFALYLKSGLEIRINLRTTNCILHQ